MRVAPRVLSAISWLTAVAAAGVACSSKDSGDDKGGTFTFESGGSSGKGGTGGTGVLITGGSGGNSAGGTGGSSGSLSVGATGNDGGTGASPACAADVKTAKLTPLDLFVMLDISGSMLDETASGGTKWVAVTNALEAFLTDPASEGLGVGIQFFPQLDPDVPATCTEDSQCGTHGPCLQKFCQNAGPDIYFCGDNSDCVADGEDYGPCTRLTYCWSVQTELALCHFDAECPGGTGDCVEFNLCSANPDYSCPVAGRSCGQDGNMELGTCQPFNPTSSCATESDCRPAVYATPAVAIAELPAAAPALRAAIAAQNPDGNTPTAPALAGAIDRARIWASDNPSHRVLSLLVTDGVPTECVAEPDADPTGIEGVRAIAAAGLAATPSISTYVIGVFGPNDTDAAANLGQIARAGGSDNAFIVDTSMNVEQELLSALATIRGAQLACEFQIPEPDAGNTLDYSQVNVEFKDGDETETLFYWADPDQCDATTGGWYYDVAPGDGVPSKIVACPASCTRFQDASEGSVSIALGCATVVR